MRVALLWFLLAPAVASADDMLSQIEGALAEIRVHAGKEDEEGRRQLLGALRGVLATPDTAGPSPRSDTADACATELQYSKELIPRCISLSEMHPDGPAVVATCAGATGWLGAEGTLTCLQMVEGARASPVNVIQACHKSHWSKSDRGPRLKCIRRFGPSSYDATPVVEFCAKRILGSSDDCETRLAELPGDATVGVAACDRYLRGSKFDATGTKLAMACIARLHQDLDLAPSALLQCSSERTWSAGTDCLDQELGPLK